MSNDIINKPSLSLLGNYVIVKGDHEAQHKMEEQGVECRRHKAEPVEMSKNEGYTMNKVILNNYKKHIVTG